VKPSPYGEKIYEGKAKILYRTPKGTLVHYFKDSATAFNAEKKQEFSGKGENNVRLSGLLFEYLHSKGIRSHFLKALDERSFESLDLKMLPVEVVVRNILAGSLAKRLKEQEGRVLNPPLCEFYLKSDEKGDPLVSDDILIALYGQSATDLSKLKILALQVNESLKSIFDKAGITLADFKLEFGKTPHGDIVLADEISPDTCRLWDKVTGEKLDKDRFRFDLGDLMTGYREISDRVEKVLRG